MKLSQYTFSVAVAVGFALFATTGAGVSQAWAYAQNVTCSNGRNACDAPGQDPKPVVWDRSCVLFYLDSEGSDDFPNEPNGEVSFALKQIVTESFAAWTRPDCSGLNLIYGGTRDPRDHRTGERRNLVTFDQEGWSQTSALTFATTVVNYNPQTGTIREADIKVNDQFYAYSTSPSPGPGQADLQNTLTHEVGHFLGMAHSDVDDATMFGSASLGETKKRTLHRDDVAGLCAHYPASEYTGTCGQNGQNDEGGEEEEPSHDGGSEAFDWGSEDEPPESDSACSVTRLEGSAMMSPMMLIVGLFGGILWRRRSRRNSDG